MSIFSTLAAAIHDYAGLSPAAFFTILALMVGVYRLVCALFVAPDQPGKAPERAAGIPAPAPAPEPVQVGDVTPEELRAYDGSDPSKPLLMAIKGNVYDVSISRMFYGPGGPYALFAGRDATRALALMSFDPIDLTSDIEGLDHAELEVLHDWELKFMEKYPKVGHVITEGDKSLKETIDEEEDTLVFNEYPEGNNEDMEEIEAAKDGADVYESPRGLFNRRAKREILEDKSKDLEEIEKTKEDEADVTESPKDKDV